MSKGSTKYQLLKDDFYLALEDIRIRNDIIKELRKENEQLKRELKIKRK